MRIILFLILLVFVYTGYKDKPSLKSASEILNERLARDEISIDDYKHIRQVQSE
ncbi:hypothetical protein KHQ82_09045 [Mycoplasmatota bacterium]|nr:hypothetical protein KHQ82_09045 [Mycoplasmatota bacterium]